MLKLSFWRLMAALLVVSLVSACGGGAGSAAPTPGGFTVTPGNGQAIISWTASPGVQYWLMYAPTATPIDISNPPGNHAWATNISSPYVITGLTNGVTYSFAMNARTDGGKGGAQTASQSVTPGYAGSNWISGTGMAASDLRGVAYGTASDSTINYVAVGAGGTIYKGLDGVSQSVSGMLWNAVTPVPNVNFNAATYAFGKFIAVGDSGTNNIYTSADMTSWTAASTSVTTRLNGIASNGTTLVTVGDGGRIYYSVDALNWSAASALPGGVTPRLNGVAYSAGTASWVAVGAGGALFTGSADGATWTAVSNANINDLNGVTATSAGVFVAVGNGGTILTSSGGNSWTAQTLGSNLNAVSTDSVQFLAVGAAGTVLSSLDGSIWTTIAQTSATGNLKAVVGSTSKYLVVGDAGGNMSSNH